MSLAATWHGQNARKGEILGHKLPYASHPFSVMKLAHRMGAGTELVLCVCLCHDLIEETQVPLGHMEVFIGVEAANIVQELTFYKDSQTKEEYLNSFSEKSIVALVVKILDRIDNVMDFADTDPKYAGEYFLKANPIWGTFNARRSEIDAYFGNEQVSKNFGELIAKTNDLFFTSEGN